MKLNAKQAAKHLGRNIQVQSPTILSAIAVVGVVATGYLTFKAAFKSAEILRDDLDSGGVQTRAIQFEKVWKLYIPAVATGVGTIGCIVASNRIAVRRLAAMAAAYGILTGDFDDYRNKVMEALGDKKTKLIDDKIAEEKILKNPPPVSSDIHTLEGGKHWFQDLSTGQNFISDRQNVEKARNDLNYMLIHEGQADLNDWYAFLGIDATNLGNQLGWAAEQKIEVVFSPVMLPDGGTATGIKLHPEPSPDFDSLH